MKYLSVCSGIEAATVAWHPLGWTPVAFSENEKFPSAVLAHHYPETPNLGDFTTIRESDVEDFDLLVGGTPCQSFSIAGLRGGMADGRGALALEFCRLAARTRPRWIVWENVPGALSVDGGRAFASILGALAQLGYGFAYRILDAQFVRVDGFGRAVPQRRRRVFVVAYLGDWRRAAAVLFEPESVFGDSPPGREARETVAGTLSASSARRSCDDPDRNSLVAHALRGEGFDASGDGTGRGTPLIPVAHTLNAKGGSGRSDSDSDSETLIPICFDETQITSKTNRCNPQPDAPSHPLARGARPPTIVFNARQDPIVYGSNCGSIDTSSGTFGVQVGWRVRRLTPRECERLQGFPDDYTAIEYRGKNAADGPRYKALGNSMAVNVMRWIGERIQLLDEIA